MSESLALFIDRANGVKLGPSHDDRTELNRAVDEERSRRTLCYAAYYARYGKLPLVLAEGIAEGERILAEQPDIVAPVKPDYACVKCGCARSHTSASKMCWRCRSETPTLCHLCGRESTLANCSRSRQTGQYRCRHGCIRKPK